MKVLVTGATGFLGSNICRRLVREGHMVTILRRQTSDTSRLQGLDIRHRIGDITDERATMKAARGQDVVLHAAAHVAFGGATKDVQRAVNVLGTKHMLEACRRNAVGRLLHVSSIGAIGIPCGPNTAANENFTFNLEGTELEYHISKRRAEELVIADAAKGLDAVVVNPSLIFGPTQGSYQGADLIGKAVRQWIIPDGPGGRCIVHVSDVVDGIMMALERGTTGERYILGGENVSFRSVSRIVCQQLALTRLRIPIPATFAQFGNTLKNGLGTALGKRPIPAYDRRFCYQFYDSTKARLELGYQHRPFGPIIEECATHLGWLCSRGTYLSS